MKPFMICSAAMLAATGASAEMSEERINELIGAYIKDHPEAIIESLQGYQARQELERVAEQQKAVKEILPHFQKDDLHYGEAGNPEGDVLIVEFFDYNCPACKMMFESIDTLLLKDTNVRVVFVEYPIFGPTSETNAKISMAVHALAPEKYYQFHEALMRNKGKIDDMMALSIAANLGIDKEKLRKEIGKEKYDDYMLQDRQLAAKLQITGTPAVIVGTKLNSGALSAEQLQEQVRWAREEEKKDDNKED